MAHVTKSSLPALPISRSAIPFETKAMIMSGMKNPRKDAYISERVNTNLTADSGRNFPASVPITMAKTSMTGRGNLFFFI